MTNHQTTTPMPLSNMLVQLKKPIQSNKKLFGLITVALLIIGGLSATYYFHIQAKQANLKEYKLRMLDSYYNKIARKLDNDILKSKAVEKNEIQKKLMSYLMGIGKVEADSEVKKNFDQQFNSFLKHLKLEEEFSEYVAVLDGSQWSSIPGLYNFNTALIFQQDTLNTGLIRNITVSEEQFLLIGRKYLFESTFDSNIQREITLIGLLDSATYNKETRELDAWAIALLSAFLLLCLIGLPFFKMVFIAEDERLFSSDVILAGISVMVGAPIVIIVFLSLMTYGSDYLIETPRELTALSKQIKQRFEEENLSNVTMLSELDIDHESYSSLLDSARDKTLFSAPLNGEKELYNNFKYVSKINSAGKVIFHLNLIQAPPPGKAPITLEDRNYYKDYVQNQNIWKAANTPYVVRPVVSIESNSEEAVYIIPTSKGSNYKVGSVQLKSLHDPILPFGYQFTMVDQNGEVWFHSQEGKSTLENIFTVSKRAEGLMAAVRGRASADGVFDYHGKTQLYHTLPIAGTNLSVIAFYDISLIRLKVSEILSICSLAIFVAFLLLAIITLISLYVKNPRWGLYKYQDFLFQYLIPQQHKKGRYAYLLVVFSFLLILIVSVGSLDFYTPSFSFLSALLIIIWSYIIVYFILNMPKDKFLKAWSIREILLVTSAALINFFIYALLSDKSSYFILLLMQLAGIFVILLYGNSRVRKWFDSFDTKNVLGAHFSYKYWYALFLFFWLILSSLFPTYVFFQKAKAIDDVIWIKTNQYNYVNAYEQKELTLKNEKLLPPKDSIEFQPIYEQHLLKGSYFPANYTHLKSDSHRVNSRVKPSMFRKLLWVSRPIFDERIRDYQALIYQSSYDSTWVSSEKDGIEFRLTNFGNHSEVRDVVSKYKVPTKSGESNTSCLSYNFGLIAGFLLILSGFYLLILYYIDRFFGFRFKHLKVNDFDTNLHDGYHKQFVKILEAKNANNGLVLIGTPFSGKRTFAEKIIENGVYQEWGNLSFLQPCENSSADDVEAFLNKSIKVMSDKGVTTSDWKNVDVFLLENIEHNLKSFEINRLKLKVISYLISMKKRIILTSEIYPSQILSYYENQTNELGQMDEKLATDYYSWRNILSSFPQIILGITNKKQELVEELSQDSQFADIPLEAIQHLAEELGHSKFLPKLAPVILSKNVYLDDDTRRVLKLDEQRMIMHILNLSHGYYTDIWNSLPRRERYLLYDLARDGFVNIKNGNSLFSLMKKGIIVWRDRPTIFNQSFRNFIVSSVSKSEALNYEYKNRGEGSWGTIRVVFYLIILTIIIFIILGEPGLLQDFETFYTALAGIGAMVPIVSSLLARGNSK